HNLITTNIAWRLASQLEGKPCETYSHDMRVKTASTYSYPDVVIACGEPDFEDRELDTLLNPTVIVEVLSPSTEAWDRGEKFFHYRALPSLKDYLLVSQERMRIEHYTKGADGWTLYDATESDDKIRVRSIECELTVSEIYQRVQFQTPDAETNLE
ncbi:MAG: Uma2 family endonuclease, partial [Acidobacteriota bacterium]|nr:Uma2 family endonuclease [Acidobacteriota bacterium]